MKKEDILSQIPQHLRQIITFKEGRLHWKISHPYLDEPDFSQIREALEKLGGKYFGYYHGEAHYEISKATTEGVTPHVVSMDKSKPPKLGMDSEAAYKEVRNGFPTEVGIKLVSVTKLVPSPWWPREKEEDLDLVESIKKHGIRQNLEARPREDGKLELVYGHRRFFASVKAGLQVVPVKIRALANEEAIVIQFEENDKQKAWSATETTHYLKTMMEKLGFKTQKELAEKTGKSETWVSRHMQIEKIAPGQFSTEEIYPGKFPIEKGELTERQARELLKATPEKREEILKEAQETGQIPSARKIEERVKPKVCEGCGVASSEVKDWNNHGINLCDRCRDNADKHPERFLAKKRTREVTEQMKTVQPEKIKDTWEFREARRRSGISRMDEAIYKRARADPDIRKLGYKVIHQKQYVLTSSDVTLEKDDDEIPLFADNEKIHLKHQDRDETITEILLWRQKIKQVVRVQYEGGFSEKKADEVWAKMKKEAFEDA